MLTNMYGLTTKSHDPLGSHVLPALIRKFHEAKAGGRSEVVCWGTGTPFREFLYADDLAGACVFLLKNYSEEQFINVGSGSEITIREPSELVSLVIGFQGNHHWDSGKPDGTPGN